MINHLNKETTWLDKLKETDKPIVLYGTGNGAEKILNFTYEHDIKISGIFASDEFVRNRKFMNFDVLSYNDAIKHFGDMVVLLSFGTHKTDVIKNIRRIANEQEFYIPDMEVCGNEVFTPKIYRRMYDDLAHVYDMLEDRHSKTVFDNLMLFKISGKCEYILNNIDNTEQINNDLLNLDNTEIYIDVGAYDGDSLFDFLNVVDNYKHIYALEPDGYNFKKLYKNFADKRNITLYDLAASDHNGFIRFNELKGKQSAVDGCGNKSVSCRKIDDIVPYATYIKFDVEGGEYEALKGCVKLIRADKPKLKVAAYHKNIDLLLPLFIKEIQPDYKVYIRHGEALPPWDLDYYFI